LVYGAVRNVAHEQAKEAARDAMLEGTLSGAREGLCEAMAILGGAVPAGELPRLEAICPPALATVAIAAEEAPPRRRKTGRTS
jgi:hypothetical protein